MKLGAVDFVQKPFFRDELLMRVRRQRIAASSRGRSIFSSGRSSPTLRLMRSSAPAEAMEKVKDLIQRAAAAPGTVLITGETGTGKELAARAIHARSPRASRAVRRRELRGADRVAARGRALRARQGCVHRRCRRARRAHRARRGRHALPRRNRHAVEGAAGEVTARARIGRGPPHRGEREPQRRRPLRRRHQHRSQSGDDVWRVPQRLVLSP